MASTLTAMHAGDQRVSAGRYQLKAAVDGRPAMIRA